MVVVGFASSCQGLPPYLGGGIVGGSGSGSGGGGAAVAG